MNNKGLVFTLATILLFFALLSLSYSYLAREKEMQRMIAQATIGSKIKYIEDDISSDILSILNITLVNISKRDNPSPAVNPNVKDLVVYFEDFGMLPRNPDINGEMRNYTRLLQNQTSILQGVDISLSNYDTSNFTLTPYNTEFSFDDSETFTDGSKRTSRIDVYTEDWRKLKSINVHMDLPIASIPVIIATPGNDSANNLVNVTVNVTGTSVIRDEILPFLFRTYQLDPTDRVLDPIPVNPNNNRVYLDFGSSGIALEIRFGKVGGGIGGGHDGTLIINYTTIDQSSISYIQKLEFVYMATNETARLQTESIVLIDPKVGSITKKGPITLAEEGYYKTFK